MRLRAGILVLPGVLLVAEPPVRIEKLPADATVGGRPCRRGWIHLYADGSPAAFTASAPFILGPTLVPAGSWVRQDLQGRVTFCSFPVDTDVEGHLCRGTGGPEGVTTAFYPNGRLKAFFLCADTVIQGLPCRAGLGRQCIELHPDGHLKGCELGAAFEQGGRLWRKGTRVHLDESGQIRE